MLLTATEIITKSWDDYIKYWKEWTIFCLALFVSMFLPLLAGTLGVYLNTYLPGTILSTDILVLFIKLLCMLLGFWSYLALVHAANKVLNVKKTDKWKEHFMATVFLLWPALYTYLFMKAVVFFGIMLFLVPGFIFFVWYFFAIYNLVVNNEKGFAALSASKKLVSGRWWSAGWRIVAPRVVLSLPLIAVLYIFIWAVDSLPLSNMSLALLENIVIWVAVALFMPLFELANLHLYYSLRDNPFREPPALLSSEPPAE